MHFNGLIFFVSIFWNNCVKLTVCRLHVVRDVTTGGVPLDLSALFYLTTWSLAVIKHDFSFHKDKKTLLLLWIEQ